MTWNHQNQPGGKEGPVETAVEEGLAVLDAFGNSLRLVRLHLLSTVILLTVVPLVQKITATSSLSYSEQEMES